MAYNIKVLNKFKKDVKLAHKRGLPMEDLDKIITILKDGDPIPESYKDHPLQGEYKGTRELHIHPDWLLIYEKAETIKLITLVRTGTHSDLF